jgi:signal transduction histidine kinase
MALAYLLATIGIVLFVELLVANVILPRFGSNTDVTAAALETASKVSKSSALSRGQATVGELLGDVRAAASPGETRVDGGLVVVPTVSGEVASTEPVSAAVVVTTAGVVVASSFPARFPIKSAAADVLAKDAAATLFKAIAAGDASLSLAAVSYRGTDRVAWSIVSIPTNGKSATPAGYAYVETPATISSHPFRVTTIAAVVALALPVGLAFGLLSTRNLRRRLRGLAVASAAVAEGDFTPRVTPASSDELGELERNFNEMAEHLSSATAHERELAGQNARLAERSRISRELHDSLSQDLFSLSLLVGGLEQALPSDSPLQPPVKRLGETVVNAVHELRALLLDLHPVALSEKGLTPALTELCTSYRARLGINIDAHLTAVPLDPAGEHAILRVAQECLTNIAKHADAEHVTMLLQPVADSVELTIVDDGKGFDSHTATATGLGLRLMRERIEALGGSLVLTSAPSRGTKIEVRLPSVPTLPQSPAGRATELVP